MDQSTQQPKPTTKVITNFGGRLTRIINGDLDSGFAKFTSSFGYDPFTKPMNLTWLENPSDITGPITSFSSVLGAPLDAVQRLVGPDNNVWVVTPIIAGNKNLYQIQTTNTPAAIPNADSVIGIYSVSGAGSFNFGSSMSFFGSVVGGVSLSDPFIYVTTDSNLVKIKTDGSAQTTVISGSNKLYANSYHPLAQFIGDLCIGNGNTIATVDSTGTVVSSVLATGNGNFYSQFNPPLPVLDRVQDLDVSVDGNYLLVTSSQTPTERFDTTGNDGPNTAAASSDLFKWNGTDQTVTAGTIVSSYSTSAQQTFLGNSMIFANDSFGSSVSNNQKKILSLPNNKAPLPNATDINGNFLVWANPEVVGNTRYVSLYYYGALDEENPTGLYRVLRWATTQTNAQVFQVPMCVFVNAKYQNLSSAGAINMASYGKHYLSFTSVNNNSVYQNFLLRFLITPTGSGTPQTGVYETQTQLFSKRTAVSQIRVYTEPTVAGNAFQLDMIGGDGNVIANGSSTYHFGDIVDSGTGSTTVERINFNPDTNTIYALGIRVTNLGTTNMTIKKIEVDIMEEGK